MHLGRDGVSFPSPSSCALARGLGGAVVEDTTPEWEGHGPVLWATARAALAGRDAAQAFGAAQLAHPVWRQGVGTAPPAPRHAKNKTAAPRAASAHIVVVHLGVSAYAHGPPRKPPWMLRTGGHRWHNR